MNAQNLALGSGIDALRGVLWACKRAPRLIHRPETCPTGPFGGER
jgi:hypothetical protein